MKLKDLFGEYFLITILGIVALLMLSIRLVYKINNKETKQPVPLTITLPTTTPVPTDTEEEFGKKFPLWKLLPYAGEGFVVEKYTEPLTLKVLVEQGSKEKAAEKVIEWMEENQIEAETHNVVWE